MAKIIFGNHTAVYAARSAQDRIRKFYCDVLGCKVRVKTDEVDRFQLDDVHFCFVYQSTALDESGFLKAIYLESTQRRLNARERKRADAEQCRCCEFPVSSHTRLPSVVN
jgi:catechol 2,3-dioxygenase-like lactoylglutathione lyase family enzyme